MVQRPRLGTANGEFARGGTLQPKACVVSGERVVSDNETHLLVFDKKLQAPSKSGNVLRINNGATLNAGVVSLGANNNTIALEKGDLNALLLDGGDELAASDSIVLGGVDGAGGSLNVGLISRYDSLVQKSGTWNYNIGGYHGMTEPLLWTCRAVMCRCCHHACQNQPCQGGVQQHQGIRGWRTGDHQQR